MQLPLPAAVPITLEEDETSAGGIDLDGFIALAARHAAEPDTVVLLSGGDHDCSRYSILARNPCCVLTSRGHRVSLRTAGAVTQLPGDPLALIDDLLERFRPDHGLVAPPFCGGLAGYLAYELKNRIERLPQTAKDDLGLPDLFLMVPEELWIHDRLQRRLRRLRLHSPLSQAGPRADRGKATVAPAPASGARVGPLTSNFTHQQYLQAVTQVRDYIRAGDVYQVNLSQRFSLPYASDPFTLFTALFRRNPAPFYAFVNAGDHQIVCTSMERFLFRRGDRIETRPIKGTRPRGATPEEDRRLSQELAVSAKDDAELSMIVDLLRNDLGRVCRAKTVRVLEHKRLEPYQNVHHLVSVIEGQLDLRYGYAELLRATFPGGSITGCPKIRAMEIIDQLEPQVRHVYTGSIGYLGWHQNMDLNIAIRTGILHDGRCHFAVGGGIVYDSDPQDEYEETLHKGRTLFETIQRLTEPEA